MFITEIRRKMKLSQKEFAERFQIPISTLRKWEQGESSPSGYLVNLLLMATPELDQDIKEITDGKNTYYINENRKTIYDVYGNSVSYKKDINKINSKNLLIYLKNYFDNLYNLQNGLNESLKRDEIDNIEWENINGK